MPKAVIRRAAELGLLACAVGVVHACARGVSDIDAFEPIPTPTRLDASVGGGDGGDGGPSTGDAMPTGAISFVEGSACPEGWEPYAGAAGRALVPTSGAAAPGTSAGTPLESGEDRTHDHTVNATFDLGSVSYVGVVGCCNTNLTGDGTSALATTSAAVSSGLPYVQLLVCHKTAAPVAGESPIPSGMLSFFTGTSCPAGWSRPAVTEGRHLVGLPSGAPNAATFGGAPLAAGESRSHVHANDATLTTSAHGIALASGCCGGGYGDDGAYTVTHDTGAAEGSVPHLQLLHCQKN